MTCPSISVALSVYNGERFLAEAIESVASQTFCDFEFLILDDGSTDRTRAIIESWAARDARIRPIIRENRGLIASLNQLLDEARAPLVARMDADDICHADRFEKQVAFFAAHPDYGVVGSWTDDIDEHGRPFGNAQVREATPGLSDAEAQARAGLRDPDEPAHPLTHEDFLHAIEEGGHLLCHSSVMYRRDIVRQVGGYHAAFRHCEDLDLWLRLAGVTRLGNIGEHLISYRRYSGQVSSRHATEQQIGAAVARIAHQERAAGRPDPTAELSALPPVAELDALFGRRGIAQQVREQVLAGLRYSRVGMGDHGFDLLLDYLREGGSHKGLWRTVARLGRFGYPLRALRLAGMLLATGSRTKAANPAYISSLTGAA